MGLKHNSYLQNTQYAESLFRLTANALTPSSTSSVLKSNYNNEWEVLIEPPLKVMIPLLDDKKEKETGVTVFTFWPYT